MSELYNNLLSSLFRPYGFVTHYPLAGYPSAYADGHLGPGFDLRFRDKTGAWWRDRVKEKTYKSKTLRNIYELNFIRSSHLLVNIGDMTLGEWIEKTPYAGEISKREDDVVIWSVSRENLEKVRMDLFDSPIYYGNVEPPFP